MMRKKILIIGGIVILICLIGGIFLWQPQPKPQPIQEAYFLNDPELFKEWDVSSLSGEVFFPKVFMMKELGCPIGAFCLECKEGKQRTMIFNRKGAIIEACLDFQGKECSFGSISGKVIKESYRPPLPYSEERAIYYVEGKVVKCFEENPAVDIKLKAPSEVITNQTFKAEIKVKNNWRVPLKNLKFALERDSQFVLINKKDVGCLSATSSNYQCEISMDALSPGEIRTFEFEILPEVWVPSNKYASPQPLPGFFLVSPELPFGSKSFYVTVLRISKPELKIYPSVPSKVKVGQFFKVRVKIANEGDAIAKNVSIKMSLPDFATTTDDLSKIIGDLKVDEVKEIEWTVTALKNEDFWINFLAQDESKKHEGEGTELVDVVAPEIQIFPTTPVEVLLNKDFTISAIIKNVGELETGNVKVKLKSSSEFIPISTTSLSIENMSPNSQKEIEWKMKGVRAGLGEIEIKANDVSVKRDITISNFPLRLETDKDIYLQGEKVKIKTNVTNENPDVSYLNLEISITIQGENISDSFSKEIPYLQAGKSTEVIFNWDTTGKSEGDYSIIAKLRYKKPIGTITYLNETSTSFRISPYRCNIVPPATKRYIRIVSPNGGEKWELGKTYTIRWISNGINKVMIRLQFQSPDGITYGLTIAQNIDAFQGSYSFYLDPFVYHSSEKASIEVVSEELIEGLYIIGDIIDYSDNCFSIISPILEPYTNKDYGFEIKHPSYISSTTTPNDWADGIVDPKGNEKLIVNLIACQFSKIPPKEPYHSFTGEVRIRVNLAITDIKDCLNLPLEFPNMKEENANINGIEFKKFSKIEDAAMGKRLRMEVYRTLHNNACFSIEKVEHGYLFDELEEPSSSHFDPESTEKFNSCRKILDQMLSTFRFLE